ncbi:MAG TPA: response regulator, partial [Nitrolancea sp.]|nr:response regulator [Nitrolancea sp.]
MRVLIVDDEAEIRDVLSLLLAGEDIEVLAAEDGWEGLRLARDEQPDLILMDIHMPVLDGVTATALLKRDPRTAHIPVIAMSAGRNLRRQSSGLSADGLLAKPFDLDELLA